LKKRTKKLLHGCRGLVGDSREKVLASFFQKEALSSGCRQEQHGEFGVRRLA
jgi:hypothetical protein